MIDFIFSHLEPVTENQKQIFPSFTSTSSEFAGNARQRSGQISFGGFNALETPYGEQ